MCTGSSRGTALVRAQSRNDPEIYWRVHYSPRNGSLTINRISLLSKPRADFNHTAKLVCAAGAGEVRQVRYVKGNFCQRPLNMYINSLNRFTNTCLFVHRLCRHMMGWNSTSNIALMFLIEPHFLLRYSVCNFAGNGAAALLKKKQRRLRESPQTSWNKTGVLFKRWLERHLVEHISLPGWTVCFVSHWEAGSGFGPEPKSNQRVLVT